MNLEQEITEAYELNASIEEINFRNLKKNKKLRAEEKKKKFKRRVKMYNEMDPNTDHSTDVRLRNTSTPCSCNICKGERYGKKDRRNGWNEAFKKYAEDPDELAVPDVFADETIEE